MVIFIIDLSINVATLILSTLIYVFRAKTFKNKIIRRKKERFNKALGKTSYGLILSYIIVVLAQYQEYVSLTKKEDVNLLMLNAFLIILSITLIVKSLKFVKKGEYVKFNYPTRKEAKKGEIEVGTIISEGKAKYNYKIKIEDLKRHMFIVGITGSGKSNFLQNFLVNYKKQFDTPILIAEFKGEYHFLHKIVPNMLIYRVGRDFCINVFDPENSNAEVHAERIFQVFRSGGLFESVEYTPQMEKVFIDILNEICKHPRKRNWQSFYDYSEEYCKKLKKQMKDNPHDALTYFSSVQAVTNRIRRYSLGTLKHIFEEQRGLRVRDIFTNNVLLDLSEIIKLGGEKEDTLFFLNMIMKYMWDINIEKSGKNYRGIQHITIIEDAQYFASQDTSKKSTISSYIEDIALLLRGTGECLISLATRPAVSPEILANAGIFVSFQNHLQKSYLKELVNLDEQEIKFLSLVDPGKCLIRVNSIGRPFAMICPYVQRESLTSDEIEEHNEKVMNNLEWKKMHASSEQMEQKSKRYMETLKKIKTQLSKFTRITIKKFYRSLKKLKKNLSQTIRAITTKLNNRINQNRKKTFIEKELKNIFQKRLEMVEDKNLRKDIEKKSDEMIHEIIKSKIDKLSQQEQTQIIQEKFDLKEEGARDFIELKALINQLYEQEQEEKATKKQPEVKPETKKEQEKKLEGKREIKPETEKEKEKQEPKIEQKQTEKTDIKPETKKEQEKASEIKSETKESIEANNNEKAKKTSKQIIRKWYP